MKSTSTQIPRKPDGCGHWLQRLVRLRHSVAPPPTEIQAGQVWGRERDKGNPFAEWFSVVEDVRDGWVKYRATTPADGYVAKIFESRKESIFRCAHSQPVTLPNVKPSDDHI